MATPDARSDVNPFSSHRAEADSTPKTLDAPPVRRTEHQESLLTRMIEHQTAKIPSSYFLFAALCAMATSLGTELADRQRTSRFVGMWVTPLLTMGLYNKIVKTLGTR
jgi:hypothetical protein